MSIWKYLDISTGHINKDTADWLDTNPQGVIVHPKGEYGWFVYAMQKELDDDVPLDLVKVLVYAKSKKCVWVVLDCDGELISQLDHYKW